MFSQTSLTYYHSKECLNNNIYNHVAFVMDAFSAEIKQKISRQLSQLSQDQPQPPMKEPAAALQHSRPLPSLSK
jgi:hypothetical protein